MYKIAKAESKKFGKMLIQWESCYTPYSMTIHKVTNSPSLVHNLFFHYEDFDANKFFTHDDEVLYNITNKNLEGVGNDTRCTGCEFSLLETGERYYLDFVTETIKNLTEEEAKEKEQLEEAKRLINEFTLAEYEQESDFSDLHNVGLAYTTLTDYELDVQATADLIDFKVTYEFDGEVYNTEQYDNIGSMLEALRFLSFDGLIYVPDEVIERHLDNKFINNKDEGKVVRIGKINYKCGDDFEIYDDGMTTLVIDWVNRKISEVDMSYFIPCPDDEEIDDETLEERFFKESTMPSYDFRQRVKGGYLFVLTVKEEDEEDE